MKPEYTIRDYQATDGKKLLDFLSRFLGEWAEYPDNVEYWHWKNIANPFGPSYAAVACSDDGDILGALAFMRWHFRRENRLIQSVRIVDAVTHPDFRREGIATALRRYLMESARREGAKLMFNTPNRNALPVSLKVGSRFVGKLRPCIRILGYRPFLMGLVHTRISKSSPHRHKTRDFFRCDPEPVSVFERCREKIERLVEQDRLVRSSTVRTDFTWEYLRWRYINHPCRRYYALFLENGGKLEGCVIFRTDTYHALRGVVINEMLLNKQEGYLASILLNQLFKNLRTDYVLTCFPDGSFHRRVLGENGFRGIPGRSYNLTVLVWDPEVGRAPLSMDNWHLTPGELEEAWAWR